MQDIGSISTQYTIRSLAPANAPEILALCDSNPQFYEYCEAECTQEQIQRDLAAVPPGVPMEHKHYLGFYEGDQLVAVTDLILGYPDMETAYIGFFMLDGKLQGRGVGSRIIQETCEFLAENGFAKVRLGIDKENPQSTYFWAKNGFVVLKEVNRNGHALLVAERRLASLFLSSSMDISPPIL